MFMGREVVVIVSAVWKGVGIGAVDRKHTTSFHVNSNKRHNEIRTSIELCYHETQTRCNHDSCLIQSYTDLI